MEERAEINPLRLHLDQALDLRAREAYRVVRCRAHDAERRLAVWSDFDFRSAGALAAPYLYKLRRDAAPLNAVEGATAALVIAHPAQQEDLVPKFASVRGKVQRSAAEVLRRANHIP